MDQQQWTLNTTLFFEVNESKYGTMKTFFAKRNIYVSH